MGYDYVAVNISLAVLDGAAPLGSLHFEVSDLVLDMSTGDVVIVPPVILTSKAGGQLPPVTVNLLAMDNATLSPNWSWIVVATLDGRVLPIPKRSLTVKLANGATQNFKDLAIASQIVP